MQLWINQLSRLFSQLSGNLCIGLDSDTYNYLFSILTNFLWQRDISTFISSKHSNLLWQRVLQNLSAQIIYDFHLGFKDSLSWLSLSNSMKTFIKISAPIYMSFSSSVSRTRECWIQARNSLIFVLNIDQWLTVMIFFLSFVSSLRHHLTSNNRVQQWTQDLLAILTFFNPRGNCLSLIGDHSQHS